MSARVRCSCGWTKRYPTLTQAEFNARRHVCKTADGVRRATRRYRCSRCGLTATYENAGATEARYWFSKHSCQKHEQLMLRAALAQQQRDLIDRTPKPCHHKQANHQHGTNACYILDRCRCEPCAKAHSTQEMWRERQKAYGRYNKYVPAGPVREHVAMLTSNGVGLKQIAKVSGVAHGALWKLVYGKKQADGTQTPSRRVLRETAEKLYAIDPDWTQQPLPLAPGALDPQGTERARLQLRALVRLGWSMSELGRRIGNGFKHPANACGLFTGDRVMQRRTVEAADRLYAELSMTLPPETNQRERIAATRSRRHATEQGWLAPLDLEAIDEPISDVDLDEVAVMRRLNGDRSFRLNPGETAEVVRRALARGMTTGQIERDLGIKPERYVRLRDQQEAS